MKKLAALLASFTILFTFASCSAKESESAEANYIYGQIESISGNDMTLLLAEYPKEDSENGEISVSGDAENSEKKHKPKDFNGEKPEGFTPPENFDGEMPEGFTKPENFDGKMPEDFTKPENFDGKMPEDFTKPENFDGEMPEGFTKPENFDGKMPESFTPPENFKKEKQSGNEQYTLTGQQEEFQIPVGTEVTTSLGVKTDFAVLKEGDIIRCTVEQDENNQQVITAVLIVEA